MKKVTITTEKTVKETKETEIPEVSYKKGISEVFMLDFRKEKPLIKGIFWIKKESTIQMQIYRVEDLGLILGNPDIIDITEEQYTTELLKVQKFLENY